MMTTDNLAIQKRCLIRPARIDDVPAIRSLINTHAERGRMLFRSQANLYESLRDFTVCEHEVRVIGCCALQILWADLAEVKSLAIDPAYQGRGLGSRLVRAIIEQARQIQLQRIFTLTLEEKFFARLGFRNIPMDGLPMKVWSDCVQCPKQDHCDEIAMTLELV